MRPHLILVSWPEKIHLPTLVRFERIYQPGKHKQKMTGSFWCVPRLTVKQWLVSVTHFKETEKAAVQKNMFFGHFAATADEKRRAKPLSQRLQVKPVSRDSCWHIHSAPLCVRVFVQMKWLALTTLWLGYANYGFDQANTHSLFLEHTQAQGGPAIAAQHVSKNTAMLWFSRDCELIRCLKSLFQSAAGRNAKCTQSFGKARRRWPKICLSASSYLFEKSDSCQISPRLS